MCVIDFFIKYAWIKHFKDKKHKTIPNAFMKLVNESNRKRNKIWVDQGRKFYNKLMQEWLHNSNILMYSTHNEGKTSQSFMKALKAKIYKKMTANDSISYLLYLNKLVDECNNTYHHSINKTPINADYPALSGKIETNSKGPKDS